MKKLIVTTSLALLLAACTQPTTTPVNNGMMQSGMMQGDMMKNCPMPQNMESMQKSMKKNCKQMAKDCHGMDGDMAKRCQDMTKICESMMSDMKAMADMHQARMQDCPMMQGGMQNQSSQPADDQSSTVPSGVSAEDHKKHHPEQ